MVKYLQNPFTILGIGALVVFGLISFMNDYLAYKDRQCLVIDKLPSPGSGRHPGYFYLILKEERGIVFEQIVSPATYSQAQRGQAITFNLRQFDIRQTPWENAIFFFGTITVGSIGLVCLLLGCIFSGLNFAPKRWTY